MGLNIGVRQLILKFDVLYRGVNSELHAKLGGELRPKQVRPFVKSPEFGLSEYGNSFFGENSMNAAIHHQQDQLGYPTSGISTTPHFHRAVFYATRGGIERYGYVYVISPIAFVAAGVSAYSVRDIVPQPSVPEDDEVILVAEDFGTLPASIVVDVWMCSRFEPN